MKRLLAFLVLAGLELGASGSAAAQGILDAPIVQTPTIRSEIKRGFQAGDACQSRTAPSIATYDQCWTSVRDVYRRTNANTDAYEVGLEARKWADLDLLTQATEGMGSKLHQWAEANAKLTKYVAQSKIRGLGITEDQFFEAAGSGMQVRKDRWDATATK